MSNPEALTESPCCTPDAPHIGYRFTGLAPGQLHYFATASGQLTVSASTPAATHPACKPTLPPDATLNETEEQLRARIAAALDALKLPHPDLPWSAWLNQGQPARRAHEARLALGADQ